MQISLCMIVKNEAENLPRCLNSVQGAVDELVVLDTGSTDRTPEIARSLGAKVYHTTWQNDFSLARNEALQYVTGDWALVLDADEALAPEIIPALKQSVQQENAIVINLVRQEIGAAQSPYSLVSRLFRRHPAIQFSRPYHALVDDSVAALLNQEPHWQVLNLPAVAILHYGYEPGTIASRDKLQKARTTMEGFFAAHPSDPYVCSKLGALYVQMGETQQGIAVLKQGLQAIQSSASELDAPTLYELHYHLGIAYRSQNPALAEQHYRSAIAQPLLDALKIGAFNNLGSLLQARGDWAGASALYQQVLEIDPNFAIGHYNLGMVLKATGQLEAAVAHYQQAIELNPDYAEAHQNLGVVLLKLGRVPDSLSAFKTAIALHEAHSSAEATRLRLGLQQMGLLV